MCQARRDHQVLSPCFGAWGQHISGVLVGSCGHVDTGQNRRMGVLKQTSGVEQLGWHCVLCPLAKIQR